MADAGRNHEATIAIVRLDQTGGIVTSSGAELQCLRLLLSRRSGSNKNKTATFVCRITRPDLTYEASSVFYEHAQAQPGDTPVYRFFDQTTGTHFYTDNQTEQASIVQTRPDLVAEGIAFYEPKSNPAS